MFWSLRSAGVLGGARLGTQLVATLIAVYALFMTPLGSRFMKPHTLSCRYDKEHQLMEIKVHENGSVQKPLRERNLPCFNTLLSVFLP
jgi:hypothetical protein